MTVDVVRTMRDAELSVRRNCITKSHKGMIGLR